MSSTDSAVISRVFGVVKWFNKKQGYGFINVLTGPHKDKDVFVHYSSIRSKDASEYKYLVQGEYVEFVIEKATKETHEFNAIDITGLCEKNTMCETRRLNNTSFIREGDDRPHPSEHHRVEDAEGYHKVIHRKQRREPRPLV